MARLASKSQHITAGRRGGARARFVDTSPQLVCSFLLTATSLLLSLAIFVFAPASARAASSPYPLSYSGRFVDELGAPLTGSVDLQIQFYRQDQTGAGLLLQALSLPRVALREGVFQVEIGLTEVEIETLFGDAAQQVWIEVSKKEADGQYRPLPRQRYYYVPYALRALNAEKAQSAEQARSAETVPVDGTTLDFDATTGKLQLLTSAWGSPSPGKFLTTNAGGGLVWATPAGSGDMLRGTYDTNTNNKVDSAEIADNAMQLGGQAASYYTNASNLATGVMDVARLPNIDAAKISSGQLAIARLPVGDTAETVAAGDDARLSDPRAPNGAAGGDLSGFYPNPTLKSSSTVDTDRAVSTDHIKTGAVTLAKLATDSVDSSKILNGTILTEDIADSAISDAKLAGITTAGKVSGSAINSGTLAGTAGFAGTGGVYLQSAGAVGADLRFFSNNNINFLGFKAPNGLTTDTTWILPPGDGTSGQVLRTGGNGTLSWVTPASGTVSSVTAGTGLSSSGTASAVTLNVNVGTGNNQIVQLDASAKLPAVDGSALTNLTPGNLSSAVSVAKGGTGATSLTANGVLYGNATSAIGATAAGSQYQVLQAGAAGSAPSFGALNLGQSAAITGILPVGNGGTGVGTGAANRIFATPTGSSGAPSFRALVGADLPITATSPLTWTASTGTLSIGSASTSANGILSSSDWNTFNNKVSSQWSSSGSNISYNSGNVGVGTTTPAEKLSVAGTIESTTGGFKFPDGTTQTSAASTSGQWTTSGSDIYRNLGNVGIGTTTPTQKLSVAGTIESTSGGVKFPDGTVQASAASPVGMVTLTDAASIAVDASQGNIYQVTLGGNRVLANPTNLVAGATYTFMFRQDATGGRTLSFGDKYLFPSSISTPTLSTAPGVTDVAQFVSDGSYLNYLSGFANATSSFCYAPSNVSVVVAIGSSNVTTTVNWFDTNSSETAYSIERSADGSTGWSSLVSVAANDTSASYNDTDLNTQSYYWRVTANCGVAGRSASIALRGTSDVAMPTGFTHTSTGDTTRSLVWNDTANEDSYQIERAANGGVWVNIANPAQNATSYNDSGLDPSANYSYRLRAVQAGSYSAYASPSMACPTPAGFSCGVVGNDCYSNINAVLNASAVTPGGRCLTMVYANGASGFLVWKDQSSTRILSPTGLDAWTMALNLSGRGRSSTLFSDPGLGTASTVLAGRACPTNVYIDDTNKVATGQCLYYSPTYSAQYPNAAGDDSGAQLGFTWWTTQTWYRGNMATCSSKRMRPPTLYEVAVSQPTQYLPTDATPAPVFDSVKGVPSTAWTWTASASTYHTSYYWVWSGTSTTVNSYVTLYAVRCVVQ